MRMPALRLRAELLESRLLPSTYYLHQGDSLQKAIDTVRQGDTILLDPGATFMGPITLGSKIDRGQWITIEPAGWPLAQGRRTDPSNNPWMSWVLSPGSNLPAIQTEPGANHYLLRGLNIRSNAATDVVDTLVSLGNGTAPQSNTPYTIMLDQCYIHGWPGQEVKRGVALNAKDTSVVNSYISDIKSTGQDSQAIAGWNGPGPFQITNNYLEAAGENVLFGGAYGYVTPAHITISNNLFSKQLSWDPYDSSYAGTRWSVKNLLELKNADNVTIDSNTFHNNWVGAQDGHSIVLTPRGAQSGGPWVTVSNITITHNIVDHVASLFTILGSDDSSTSQVVTNVTIGHNLFGNDIGTLQWGGGQAHFLDLLAGRSGGAHNIVVDHNTILAPITSAILSGMENGFQFTNNILFQGQYGLLVNGLGKSRTALPPTLPQGYTISHNAIIWGDSSLWPPGNWFPAFSYNVGFVKFAYPDFQHGDFRLSATSPYHNKATDGTDLGANIPSLGEI